MPCNSEYLAASGYEKEISRVACLLDELAGKKWERSWWDGYHPKVYSKCSRNLGDRLTKQLCSALRKVNVTQYSLEMQLWWRDHQAADRARVLADHRAREVSVGGLLKALAEGAEMCLFEYKPADGTGPHGCWKPLQDSGLTLSDVNSYRYVFRKKEK